MSYCVYTIFHMVLKKSRTTTEGENTMREFAIMAIVVAATTAGCSNYDDYNEVPFRHDRSWLSNDKAGHFGAGVAVGTGAAITAGALGADTRTAAVSAAVAAGVAGVGKEWLDYNMPPTHGGDYTIPVLGTRSWRPGEGKWEMADAVATFLGGAIPALAMFTWEF